MKESRRVRFPLFFTWFFHYVNVAEYCSRITTKFGIFEHSLTFKGKKLHVYEITTNKNIERKHSYTTYTTILTSKYFEFFYVSNWLIDQKCMQYEKRTNWN